MPENTSPGGSESDQRSPETRVLPDIVRARLENVPTRPGVYLFRNAAGDIIYVGKAKNLRSRVRSYFQDKGAPDPKREVMTSKIADIEIVVTDSEVEALLLENTLIKEHAPRYNIRLKDDKSYPYIVVTNEPYPRIFPTRRVVRDGSRYYGPYADVRAMHLMLRTIRGIFPIRSCDFHLTDETVERKKYSLCLDYHIHKCEGPCEGLVSREEYNAVIRQAEQLLKGKTRAVRQALEDAMAQAAEALEFERAATLRNRLQALITYQDRQKVATSDFADRDIAAAARSGPDAVGVLFRVRDGKIVGRQQFVFAGADFEGDDVILRQLLERYYANTPDIPPEVLLPIDLEDADALGSWLSDAARMKVAVVVPKIGDKAKLVRMCQANAQFLLDGILLQKLKTDDIVPKSVQALQRDLRLPDLPRRIECFDISHLQGAETVASMVCFLDGKPRKSEYRKFKIESVEGVDDFASMREVVRRRYTRVIDEGAAMPDLIVIDGGKGQLSSAVSVLAELDRLSQPVIGLAKRLEEVFVHGDPLPLTIAKTSPGLRLLQRIRDEAHRFAITYHRQRRTRAALQTELEEVEGVGPARAKELLEKLGSVRAVRQAAVGDIAAIIGWSAAQNVHAHFHAIDGGTDEDAAGADDMAGDGEDDSNEA